MDAKYVWIRISRMGFRQANDDIGRGNEENNTMKRKLNNIVILL
jgi:hypothetical protein